MVGLFFLAVQAAAAAQSSTGSQLQQRLNAAVAAKQLTFALPSGDVRFARGEGLLLNGAANIALVGDNTTLWFEPGGGLKVLRCENVRISGVVIDYDPLPYVQAEILAMAPADDDDGDAPDPKQRALPPAALAPCASAPTPGGKRPTPPCPHGWWQPAGSKLCDQVRVLLFLLLLLLLLLALKLVLTLSIMVKGCPSGAQARNAASGRCLCGGAAPNNKCLAGESCVGGQCSDPHDMAAPRGTSGSSLAGQVWELDAPFKGFVSNAASTLCLNVDDCTRDLIYDGCPAAESKATVTCAGKGNYSIFQVRLRADAGGPAGAAAGGGAAIDADAAAATADSPVAAADTPPPSSSSRCSSLRETPATSSCAVSSETTASPRSLRPTRAPAAPVTPALAEPLLTLARRCPAWAARPRRIASRRRRHPKRCSGGRAIPATIRRYQQKLLLVLLVLLVLVLPLPLLLLLLLD